MSEENKNEPSYTFWAEQVSQSQDTTPADQTATGTNSNTSDRSTASYQPNQNNQPYQPFQPYQNNMGSYQAMPAPKPPKKKGKIGKVFGFLGKAAIFGAFAGLAFYGVSFAFGQTPFKGSTDQNTGLQVGSSNIASTVVSKDVNIQSTDVSAVVEDTMPAIVAITSTFSQTYQIWGQQYQDEQDGGGSGIIIGKNDDQLFIATNNHVVDSATKITVTFIDGSTGEATVRGCNSAADLAVITVDLSTLKADTINAIKVAKLGSSEDIKVGQMAIAIGNALGYGQSVTVGYISAKDRQITTDANATLTVLQTDAAINPGNSGGALININGEVIGINSAKLANTNVEGMGYSIPIDSASPIVDELMNREVLTDAEKGYLGLYPRDIDSTTAQRLNWPQGVYVYELVEGGAAQTAGIYAGDIITSINDISIATSDQLRETVNAYRYGTTITVTLMRYSEGEYTEMTVDVVLQQNTDANTDTKVVPNGDAKIDPDQNK